MRKLKASLAVVAVMVLLSLLTVAPATAVENASSDEGWVKVVPGKVTTVLITSMASSSTTVWRTTAWITVEYHTLAGRMFSFKLTKVWDWDRQTVLSSSMSLVPDVTSAGSALGWLYIGEYQPRSHHFYTWNGKRHGGHVSRAYGEFRRCIGGQLGQCFVQKFAYVRISGHYDGSNTHTGSIT